MKLLEHFNTFLGDQVDLNQTRVDQLDSSVSAVQTAIKDSGWRAPIIEFSAHGSWAHGTIIKPLPENEFDADLLAIVDRTWLHRGSIVVADNVGFPGSPRYRAFMREQQGKLEEAKEAGKEVGGLETVEEQLAVFDSASAEAQVRFLDEMPMTITGKIRRVELRRKEEARVMPPAAGVGEFFE